jgi:ZIP family zinc transporter
MDTKTVMIAFALTLMAGLSTGIGSALAFFAKKTNPRFLAVSLGFSAGVMIYVSFVELFAESLHALSGTFGNFRGYVIATFSFFAGIVIIGVIDRLVPSFENPHEARSIEEMDSQDEFRRKERGLVRVGLFSALAIAIHNFPEGIATFTASLQDLSIGIPIAIAIAIHNIPEGIAVSIPLYYGTGNRKKAFAYSLLSGLSEPIGALMGFILLFAFFNNTTFGIVLGIVAGIMVYISLDELLPAAREWGEHHLSIYGLIGGMFLMAMSLIMLR